jgi:hypothetical protein
MIIRYVLCTHHHLLYHLPLFFFIIYNSMKNCININYFKYPQFSLYVGCTHHHLTNHKSNFY